MTMIYGGLLGLQNGGLTRGLLSPGADPRLLQILSTIDPNRDSVTGRLKKSAGETPKRPPAPLPANYSQALRNADGSIDNPMPAPGGLLSPQSLSSPSAGSSFRPLLSDALSGIGSYLVGYGAGDPQAAQLALQSIRANQQGRYERQRADQEAARQEQLYNLKLADYQQGRETEADKLARFNKLLPTLSPELRSTAEAMGPSFLDVYGQKQVDAAFPKPEAMPSSVQEYNFDRAQGYTGSYHDWVTEKAAAGKSETNINFPGNPTPDEIGRKKFAEENASSQAKYWNDAATAGTNALQSLGEVNQLAGLLEQTPQGAGQDWANKFAAYGQRLGIDTSDFANLDAAQAAQSIISRIAPTLRVAGSGATSDFEMRQFMNSLPSLTNTPGGNRIIASNLRKMAERSIDIGQIANQVQSGELTPAEGRKKVLALGPLNFDLPSANAANPRGGRGMGAQGPSMKSKYNLD